MNLNRKRRKIQKLSYFKFAVSGVGVVYALKWLFPIFSIKLLSLVFVSIFLLLWINASKRVVINNFKKIFVYAVFIPFVLLSNNVFELSVQNIVLVTISVFFSIDRVINLVKELKQKIENESLKYLLEKMDDGDWLIKQKVSISKDMKEYISEKLLIRQIVIYYKLGLAEVNVLLEIYQENNFKKESMIIGGIRYFIETDKSETLEEEAKYLEEICKNNTQDICFIPVLEEYAKVLYLLGKRYKTIISLLEDYWLFIEEDSKYILYDAYLKMDMPKQANVMKREINNFEQVEIRMKRNIDLNIEA